MGDEAEYFDDGADYINSKFRVQERRVYCHDEDEYVPIHVCRACGDCDDGDD